MKVLVNDILVELERILDYAVVKLERFDCMWFNSVYGLNFCWTCNFMVCMALICLTSKYVLRFAPILLWCVASVGLYTTSLLFGLYKTKSS